MGDSSAPPRHAPEKLLILIPVDYGGCRGPGIYNLGNNESCQHSGPSCVLISPLKGQSHPPARTKQSSKKKPSEADPLRSWTALRFVLWIKRTLWRAVLDFQPGVPGKRPRGADPRVGFPSRNKEERGQGVSRLFKGNKKRTAVRKRRALSPSLWHTLYSFSGEG